MNTTSKKSNFENDLAKWLNSVREEKGISQEALAIQIGKGQSDIAKIENGSKKVTVSDLLLWVSALGLDYNRIEEILRPEHLKLSTKLSLWTRRS